MSGSLLGKLGDGILYPVVGSAAAEIAAQAATDVFGSCARMAVKKRLGSDHKTGGAEPALGGIVFHEGLLDGMQLAVLHERLHRGNGLSLRLNGQHRASVDGLVVEQHGAGAALAAIANALGSRDIKLIAQRIQQSDTRLNLEAAGLAIDGESDGDFAGAIDLD